MFSALFCGKHKRSELLCIDSCCQYIHTIHCRRRRGSRTFFCLRLRRRGDNPTAFQYTRPRIIISHQNSPFQKTHFPGYCIVMKSVLCALTFHPLLLSPDFARLLLEAGHTGSYYWHPRHIRQLPEKGSISPDALSHYNLISPTDNNLDLSRFVCFASELYQS